MANDMKAKGHRPNRSTRDATIDQQAWREFFQEARRLAVVARQRRAQRQTEEI